ncbi:UDP-sugar pyrophosphorylase [Trypanosoma grayi]|uniref:UDP-sugar pyrophosphorylase n=1 Tax=Trypanosoma grayi TaxID=71804 RepID=UPI0004F48550|nr:UDP-sugar pyrophosphorylase [Trypanosoma grayi]KEG08462.1 UDP-sugar pyrophosphorylase [Trypanosoma grayi]
MQVSQAVTNATPSLQELHALRVKLEGAEFDQSHLFKGWPGAPEAYTEEQKRVLTELYAFARQYNGGVEQYVCNGRRLLAESGNTKQDIVSLEKPLYAYAAPSLFERSEELVSMEQEGLGLLKKSVFVLVAGGLGERLGYSGIKVGLPVESATHRCYLVYYFAWVKHVAGPDAPFVIMTSDDTHEQTQALLREVPHGMQNVHLVKQGTVFCFTDTAAHLAVKDGKLLRKPHGHGDVHSLLYQALEATTGRRLVDIWLQKGYTYIVFMQDTNVTATLTIPVSLAISERERLAMNFTCIPRQPKEAIGLLCDVRSRGANVSHTVNIEYNMFEAVAASLWENGGDCAAPNSPYSPFPGSINTLLLKLTDYVPLLAESHGAVPEFINPKYTDEAKTMFKPCRIESLMQDVALLFKPAVHRVGGTTFTRFTYQPVKNALQDGIKKTKEGLAAYCATTGEESFYEAMRLRLHAAGLTLPSRPDDACDVEVSGTIKVRLFPVIVADVVAMGASLAEISQLLLPHPQNVKVSARSVLIVEGRVRIESLDLDGALRLTGPTDERAPPLVIRGMTVKNASWTVRPTRAGEDTKEVDNIRGFVFEEHETQRVHYAKL